MGAKKSRSIWIEAQETLRFSDEEERAHLNSVLGELREIAEGEISKSYFLRALMGLRKLNLLTQDYRDYLSGGRKDLPKRKDAGRTRARIFKASGAENIGRGKPDD